MNKTELREVIAEEVRKELKKIVPLLVKPHVQEAVACALSALLTEGIVNGLPSRQTKSEALRNSIEEEKEFDGSARRSLMERMGFDGAKTELVEEPVVIAAGMPSVKMNALERVMKQTIMEKAQGVWNDGMMGPGK